MNRKLRLTLLIAALACTVGAKAQLKVGSPAGAPNSSAILDASNSSATSTTYKGIYLPQVALTSIAVYGLNTAASAVGVDGMMVYNTATVTGATGVTPGIYIWGTSSWTKVNTSAVGNDKNIYEGSGTLTGNRSMDMANNNLTFSNPGIFQINTSSSGERLRYTATGAIPAGMQISNDNGTGRIAVAGNAGDYGAPVGGDLMINNNTANKGVGISTTGHSGSSVYVAGNGNVGINNDAPAASAVLDVSSPNKAVLLPRVPTTASITAPVDGMIIYDISSKCIKAYENGAWTACLSAMTPAGPQVEVNCNTSALNGSYTRGNALTPANTFTVNLVNNSFTGATISTSTGDVIFSGDGAPGMSISAVSPSSLVLNGGGGVGTITYTVSGTPTAAGSFVAT